MKESKALSENQEEKNEPETGERIAKVLAHAGIASRRDAERMIEAGRISVNGKVLISAAVKVSSCDEIAVDGQPIGMRPPTRVWRYHKPSGLLTTHKDPQGRETVFETLPKSLGRVISVGRLDLSSEGLLLLTNNGELARVLELPATAWTRRYRVRAYGRADDQALAELAKGVTIDGINYGPCQISVDRRTGANVWLTVGLKEGKNREVRKLLNSVGLTVNRLMRVAYGPFQLGSLKKGETSELKLSILREQLGQLYPLNGSGFPTDEVETSVKTDSKPGDVKSKRKKTWAKSAKKTHVQKRKAEAKSKPKSASQRGEFLTAKEGRHAHSRRRS